MNAGHEIINEFLTAFDRALGSQCFDHVDSTLHNLDGIQEQPQLIDPHVQYIVDRCTSILVPALATGELDQFHKDVYCIIYHLTKIRGSKVIGKSFDA